jgi:fatty-acyl-CoA synthase
MSIEPIVRTPSAYAYPLLIKHLLHTPLAHAPEQEIVYRELRRYDYRTLVERIHRLGSALTRLGVRSGDTVAVMDWDSHRYLECYFAVPMLGAVLQTVNVRLSPEQVHYTLEHAGATLALVHDDFAAMCKAVRATLPALRGVVRLTDDPTVGAGDDGSPEYEALLAAAATEHDFPDFDENARATTFYTTGTTGLPKGVYFSHRQVVLHTLATLAGLAMPRVQGRFHRADVYMPVTPMFHVHAWGLPYLATVAGVKQVYPGRYVPESILKLKQAEGVTFSHCVPTILHMLLTAPGAERVDWRGWKVVIGGSALPKALAQAAVDRGIDIIAGYGMSETCPVLTLAQVRDDVLGRDPERELELRCKAGVPIPLVDLRVVDDAMKPLPKDGASAGEVVVRAPWLTQGYLRNPDASEQLWAGGWMHTNDIGHIDARGYLKITDRIKDVIKTGGEWVSSLQLEDLIAQHPTIGEVAVISVKDERWGERPLALVVPRTGQQVDEAAIKAHVKTYADAGVISKYAVPDRVRVVAAIDKTSVGKIDKKVLRTKYGSG